jgi:hypothetical protein
MCSARSSHTGAGFAAFTRRRFPFAGFRSISSYPTATSRICASRAIVLLIDAGDSTLTWGWRQRCARSLPRLGRLAATLEAD